MGSVYVAEHPVLGRRVAIKVLKREFAEDKQLVARFMNEARAASAIRQPNIIEIMDVGTLADGLPYLMMELLEGESLASRIHRERRLPVEDAIAIASQAATALGAAHAKQIVHRDLKPDNLYLVPDENAPRGQRLVVLDFGIAKLRGDLSSGSVKTHTGSVMGTPPYMSPEQCRGLIEDIDHRTDIYAMGIILHEMLAGAPPFVSAGFGDLLMMHLTKPPPPLRGLDATIPPYIEAAVLRALEKQREARFSSMAELKSALLGAVGMPIATAPRGVAAAAGGAASPKTISTLTTSTGEMLAPDAQATVPMRRSKRGLVIGGLVAGAGVAGALALGLASRPAGRDGASPSAAASAPSPSAPPSAPSPSAAPPAPSPPSASPPPPAAAPAPAVAAPVAPPPPARVVPAPTAPAPSATAREAEPEHHEATRAKHGSAHASRAKTHAGDAPHAAATPAPVTPPSVAPAPPPAKPTPKLSADKW
jgi:serine/threonine-protein kinase